MTTPCSPNSISLAQVRTELGGSGVITMNDSDVRSLAGKPSGIITMDDLRCKSNVFYMNDKYPLASGYDMNTVRAGISSVQSPLGTLTVKTYSDWENTHPNPEYDNAYKAFDGTDTTLVDGTVLNGYRDKFVIGRDIPLPGSTISSLRYRFDVDVKAGGYAYSGSILYGLGVYRIPIGPATSGIDADVNRTNSLVNATEVYFKPTFNGNPVNVSPNATVTIAEEFNIDFNHTIVNDMCYVVFLTMQFNSGDGVNFVNTYEIRDLNYEIT